ncbi:MAG TPA: hypothetical protein DIW80_22070 [Gordonia polyisoprenivorans]|nr:hypothetical protein [Gordonia polyisoprenivorans]
MVRDGRTDHRLFDGRSAAIPFAHSDIHCTTPVQQQIRGDRRLPDRGAELELTPRGRRVVAVAAAGALERRTPR